MIRLVPADVPLVAEVEIDTRDVARLKIGDPVTVKLEALPWQQHGLAYGELKTLTPDTVEDRSARETAEDMTAPGLKTQMRQSPIHYRAPHRLDRDQVSQPAAKASNCALACASSPTSRSAAARSCTTC